jgi:hypothetical protein
VTLTPTTITAGGAATLSWTTTDAATVTIDQGIGAVTATGTRTVSPGTTTTYTLTATNITGSATSSATLTVIPAAPGFSLQFNGSTQRARFTPLPAMSSFTVEGWVKRTADAGGYESVFSDASSNYGQLTVGVYVDGGNFDCGSAPADQFAWAYRRTDGGWFIQCSGVSATLHTWHHVAVTREGATARIFIDGVLRATAPNPPPASPSSGAFGLGNAGDAALEFFAGLLDEVRVSNVVRYTSSFTPPSGTFAPDAATVALYHLDEGTGQTLADASGNNRHGVRGTSSDAQATDPTWSSDTPID